MAEVNTKFTEKESGIHRLAGCLSFLLPVLIMLIVFMLRGIYPFGNRSFLSTDLYHQYMPFMSGMLRAVKSGEGLSYTWNVGVGSNFLALYVYYLASPFHWLGLLVPEAYIMEFITYLVVFKIGLCGLSCFHYLYSRGRSWPAGTHAGAQTGLQNFRGDSLSALCFSLAYALSGFLAAYNWNIMWLDCVILLPLIALGLERLVKQGEPVLYCVTLGLSILTNYYISIMICIFLVLYFILLYTTERHPMPTGDIGRGRRIAAHLRPIGQFALYSLLAGGLAAVLLIPEVCAILETDFGNISFPEKAESYFSVLDVLARHCVAVQVEKGLDHWPNIFCGAGVFLFVPLYALNERIPARKRFGMLALAGIMLLSFSTNVLNFIWHGLNYPDSLPARQSFIYILLVLVICHDTCSHLNPGERHGRERVVHVYLGAVTVLLLIEKFVEHEDFLPGVEWLTLLFVTVYAALLYMSYSHQNRRWQVTAGCLVVIVVAAELCVNTYCTSVNNVSRESYLGHLEDYEALYEWTAEQEDGFYRLEKFTRKTKNDGMLVGYPTASVFASTLNSSVVDLYERLGMLHSKVYYGYDGATAFTSALLNVKYLFGESDGYENSLYSAAKSMNDVTVYRAKHTLPFGYVAPLGYDLPEGFENSPLRLQNQMVHDLGIAGQLFENCDRDISGDNVMFTAATDGVYYGLITTSGTKKVKVLGAKYGEMSRNDLKKGTIIYLGAVEKGETVVIMNNDESDTSKDVTADIYRVNEDVLCDALGILSENYLDQVEYDSTHLTGRLTLEEPGRLILSVPYEKGWKVLINGEETTPALFGGTFMAFDLQPGEYELRMHYVPYGKNAGILVSVVSVLCFGLILWLRRRSS